MSKTTMSKLNKPVSKREIHKLAENGPKLSPEEQEKEIEEFRQKLHRIFFSLEKTFNEKDLRKAYREQEGHSINQVIVKFDLKQQTLFHFLRYHCQSICQIFQSDKKGEFKFVRLDSEQKVKACKKKKHCNQAPKLNLPPVKTKICPSLNPQGYSKHPAPVQPVKSVPKIKAKYQSTAYRPAAQLAKFQVQGGSPSESEEDDEERFLYHREEQPVWNFNPPPPKVLNPFEFPNLPGVRPGSSASGEGGQLRYNQVVSTQQEETHEESQSESGDEEQASNSDMQSVYSEQQVPQSLKFNLDDPIFRIDFPDIITDESIFPPSPRIVSEINRLAFTARLTVIYSPSQFYFQYCDREEPLNNLMDHLNDVYSSPNSDCLVISNQNLKQNLIVAANYNNIWHRAQVVTEPDDDNEIFVLLIDYGNAEWVSVSQVRYLLKIFSENPVQALRGSLIGVAPPNGFEEWNKSACHAFYRQVQDKTVFAAIRYEHKEFGIYEMDLNDDYEGGLTVSEILINKEFADRKPFDPNLPYSFPLNIAADE